MNPILPIVLRGTQAAQNNALAGDRLATIEALEDTVRELKVEWAEAHANEAGIVQIHPAGTEPSRYPVMTRAQAEIVRDQADAPSAA